MSMPWNGSYTESTRSSRSTRPTYLPPHLRNPSLPPSNVEQLNINAYDDVPVEVTGADIPEPLSSFSEIGDLYDNIRRCNYVKPTPIQRYAIPVGMAGRDMMACAQTGSGKTAAFCLPIISGILKDKRTTSTSTRGRGGCAFPLALILSPTRELSCQVPSLFHNHILVLFFLYTRGSVTFMATFNLLTLTMGVLCRYMKRRRSSLT